MILQEAPLGSTRFVDSDTDPKVKTSSRGSITHVAIFDITTTKEYRVKMTIQDVVNDTTYTTILYEELQ